MPKLLVANRGEIAIRVLRSAKELEWDTVAIYTKNDANHATYADESIQLSSEDMYMDASAILNIAQSIRATHVHPGYGFLSESAKLSQMLSSALPPIVFIGPSIETLHIAGDKMKSRQLAASLHVPIAPGMHISSEIDVHKFCKENDYPVMIKALDGGGGRGIRLVSNEQGIPEAYKRCRGESPSKQIFVEKALVGDGWRHIEVQIIGDGTGKVIHLWERDCSLQRRFQKVIEMAPSRLPPDVVQPLLKASLRMARNIKYHGLGTFEFLVNSVTHEWIFLEINPRIQVEHTVTEEITSHDLVQLQLSLFQPSTSLRSLGLSHSPEKRGHAIQLRLTAEDPTSDFALSVGRITSLALPSGRGVRVDTWLSSGYGGIGECVVSHFFDSLLAKIIVTGKTFDDALRVAKRAIREVRIDGNVKTNVDVLSGVLAASDWRDNRIDTLWLERNIHVVLKLGKPVQRLSTLAVEQTRGPPAMSSTSAPSSRFLPLEPGASFRLELTSANPVSTSATASLPAVSRHILTLSSISHNAFPSRLSGTMSTSFSPLPLHFSLSQSSSTSMSSSQTELSDPNNPQHVGLPLSGKIVELHPALTGPAGGFINKGDVIAVVSVMKMETTVTAEKSGRVKRTGRGVEVGVVANEGTLLCSIIGDEQKSKL